MTESISESKKLWREVLAKATDPHQYDAIDIDWEKEGEDNPLRNLFFHAYLDRYLPELQGSRVIDIGSGTGSLASVLQKHGARSISGIEPSEKNVRAAKKLHPEMDVSQNTLLDYRPDGEFDIAIAVMVFEHIEDIDAAFAKIRSFLRPGGKLYIIVSDKTHFTKERLGYSLKIYDDPASDTAVVRSEYAFGPLYDVVRPTSQILEAAKKMGFTVNKQIPMPPTEELIQIDPRYAQFRDLPMTHLLIFEKQE